MADILFDWISETGWMPKLHSRNETHRFLQHLHDTMEVTVSGDTEPKGFLARSHEEIPALYVSQGARRDGHGSALLNDAKQHAKRLSLWTFQQNGPARNFYARHGFVETGQTDGARNEENLPDVRLEWSRA